MFDIQTLRTTEARELAWCVSAPSLLAGLSDNRFPNMPNSAFFSELAAAHADLFLDADASPEELRDTIHNEERLILGKRFEKILGYFFEKSPRYELIHKGLVISHNHRTEGELDFILRDREDDRFVHIETACKYYLGFGNRKDWNQWLGINPKDTLALKARKLERQAALSARPEVRDLLKQSGVNKCRSEVWLKGYFFHHFRDVTTHISPRHACRSYPSGWWMHTSEARAFFSINKGQWAILPKESWLAPAAFHAHDSGILTSADMLERIGSWGNQLRSAMVVSLVPDSEGWLREKNRGVVVSDGWPG